jgi:hypothetical protein
MSITDAFRNLNSSIRGIRTDEMQHEQRMMDLKNKQIDIQGKMNDPRIKAAKAKAADEISLVDVQNPFPFEEKGKTGVQIDGYKNTIMPAMRAVLPPEADLDESGRVVFKGTDTPYKQQKWQARELSTQMNMAAMGTMLGDGSVNNEVYALQETITGLKSRERMNGQLNSAENAMLRNAQNNLAVAQEELNDPTKRLKRLRTEKINLSRMYSQSVKSPYTNPQFMNHVERLMDNNRQERKMLLDQQGKKYFNVPMYQLDEKGEYTGKSITEHMPEGEFNMFMSMVKQKKGVFDRQGSKWTNVSPGKTSTSRIWMHNPTDNTKTRVDPTEIKDYEDAGYKRGLPMSTKQKMTVNQGISDLRKRFEDGEFGDFGEGMGSHLGEYFKKKVDSGTDPSKAHTETMEHAKSFNKIADAARNRLQELEDIKQETDRIGPWNKPGYKEAVESYKSIEDELMKYRRDPVKYHETVLSNKVRKAQIIKILKEKYNIEEPKDRHIVNFYLQTKHLLP